MSDVSITVSAPLLRAAALFASTEETRYCLNGVYLGDDRVVATDGRCMFVGMAETGAEKIIVPSGALARMKLTRQSKGVSFIHAGGRWQADAGDGYSIGFRPIDGMFPDWTLVLPTNGLAPGMAPISPSIMARIEKAAAIIAPGALPDVGTSGNNSATVFSFGGAIVVAMPYRNDGKVTDAFLRSFVPSGRVEKAA